MERHKATELLRSELIKWQLHDWSIRLNQDANSHFLGLCSHKDRCIILSAHHIDIHPDPDVIDTIRHEVAHALTPGHSHDEVWEAKAREVGCDNTLPCSNLSLSPEVIDAIRSGATVEVTYTEQVIRTPKFNITRLQDKCEICGKVAKQKSEYTLVNPAEDAPDMKFITLECGHTLIKKIPKGTPFYKFQAYGDEKCAHTWDKNNCVLCGRKRLYKYQVEGAAFLETGLAVNHGAACFDEMGLGKTQQAGAVLFFHKELWPCLWIVKSGLKYQTNSFILNWMPEHYAQIVESSKTWLIPGFRHYIIGYDMLVPKVRTSKKTGKIITSGFDITQFDRIGIKCVILDECQQIKNVDSTRTQMVRRVVKGRKVIPLSGTPWNNKGSELYPVFNMMDPIKFNTEKGFKSTWVSTYFQGRFEKEGGIRERAWVGGRGMVTFKEYTKDLCIRRERKEVMTELPSVNRTKLNVVFDATEEQVYDAAVDEFVKWYEEQASHITGMAIIAAMAKMRHLVAVAKIPTTEEYVDEFIDNNPDRKLCIFAHHQDVQQILYEDLKDKYDTPELRSKGEAIPVFKYFAEMNPYQRDEAVNDFTRAKRAIFVMSQGSGGEGVNLQTCCDCIMHERQWNPGREEQCEGRFVRIGSLFQVVNAIYTHMEGLTAIDSQLDGIVERKRRQFYSWTGTEAPQWNEDSIMKELAESIVAAHKRKKAA